MKSIFILLLLFLTSGQTQSCNEKTFTNQEFTINYGQTLFVKDSNLQLKFVSIGEDSRCPQGAQCIRAGNAAVNLEVSQTDKNSVNITLNTNEEPKAEVYQQFTIKLTSLKPIPKDGVDIKTEDYSATLKVCRQDAQKNEPC